MLCPHCYAEIPDGSQVCSSCGEKIPYCPTCGKVLVCRTRYCPNDHTQIPEELFLLIPGENETETSGSARKQTPPPQKNPLPAFFLGAAVTVLLLALGGLGGFWIRDMMTPDSLSASAPTGTQDIVLEADVPEESLPAQTAPTEPSFTQPETQPVETLPEEIVPETTVTETATVPQEEEFSSDAGDFSERSPEELEDFLQYFIANCDTEYFSEADIQGFDDDMCCYARNAVYAKSGRVFTDPELRNYFLQYEWYQPTIAPEDFTTDMLNDCQIANRNLILAYEAEHGY